MELSILNLLLVLIVAWLAGQAATRLGYPSVLGELVAGIVLGPPLLGLLHGSEALALLAEVGILLMMLYIGMEINPNILRKSSKGGFLAAIGGFITPFVLCYLVVIWAGGTVLAAIFVGVAAGVTSLATKSRILVDLQLLDTRIAHVLMIGALIADTLSLVIFAAVLGVAEVGSLDLMGLGVLVLRVIGFFVVAVLIGVKVLPLLFARVQKMESVGRTGQFTLILIVALVYTEGAELVKMHGILGTFLAGLFLQETVLGYSGTREMRHLVRDVSLGFLAPIFFVTAGFAVSLSVFSTDLGLLVAIVGLATVGKIVGTMLFYLFTGYGWREGLTIGAGMNGRGAVEIIVAQIGLSLGLISQDIFSILVFMAIATTATVPLFLKWGVAWLRKRGELVSSGEERQGVLILGAGPTARALGSILARTQPVWMVDRNPGHCRRARDMGMNVVQGNALEEEVLSRAQAAHVQYFIALTENAEVNVLGAQTAKTVFRVPDVHVLSTSASGGDRDTLDHIGGTTVFAGPIPLQDWDYRVDHDEVERLGLPVLPERSPEQLFENLQHERKALPLALHRGDTYLPFHSGSTLEAEDRLIVLHVPEIPSSLADDRFERLASQCPVMDIEQELSMETLFGLVADDLAPRLDVDPAALADKFIKREASSSTVLLPGVAIPHIVVEGTKKFEMMIVRCRGGVLFPGQAERVHTVFVLAGSPDERTFHLRALAAIAKVIQWPDFETNWMKALDAEALRHLVVLTERMAEPGEADASGVDTVQSSP